MSAGNRSGSTPSARMVHLALRKALQDATRAGLVLGAVACSAGPRPPLAPDDAVAEDSDAEDTTGGGRGGGGGATGGSGGAGSGGAMGGSGGAAACATLRPPPCEGGHWALLGRLRPGAPVDHLELWWTSNTPPQMQGRPCADAADPTTCLGTLEQARTSARADAGVLRFIGTRAGEVFTLRTPEEFVAFFKPIDTETEAAFIASFRGLEVSCAADLGSNAATATGIACHGDGYEATYWGGGCQFDGAPLLRARIPRSGEPVEVATLPPRGGRCSPGRAPDGLTCLADLGPRSPLEVYLREAAMLEAASVPAFLMLAEDLRALGAPLELVEAAQRAALDEVRHAAAFAGVAPAGEVEVPVRRRKSLAALALENAVEGCVRETYAALVALHQAEHAQDPAFASVMAGIASDELRHAALAHDIAAWAEPQLASTDQAVIAEAKRAAIAELGAARSPSCDEASRAAVGLPSEQVALALVAGLRAHLWC